VTKFYYARAISRSTLNAYQGSAFSLEPILSQSAWFRGHNRDDKIKNFYLVGAGTIRAPGFQEWWAAPRRRRG
jgi:phytoene desaturase